MVDWTKPIQFENGQPCEIIASKPEGWTQWGARADGLYPTRMIHRNGVEHIQASTWFMHEDGVSTWPKEQGYTVINIPEEK